MRFASYAEARIAPVRRALYLAPFGELSHPDAVADVAAAAEASGFDGVFVWDHIWRDPARVTHVGDAWVTLCAVAARTERIRLGPMVVPLSRRRPQKVARESVALDLLSHGRLTVGVGLGVNTAGELTRFGEQDDPAERAAILDEALELLRSLWSGHEVHHDGPHFRADGVAFLPVACQTPGIPLWGAAQHGSGAAPLRRAARLDGLFPVGVDLDELGSMLEVVRAERGGLDGYDVALVRPPGASVEALEARGVTWVVTALAPTATRDEAFRAASDPGA